MYWANPNVPMREARGAKKIPLATPPNRAFQPSSTRTYRHDRYLVLVRQHQVRFLVKLFRQQQIEPAVVVAQKLHHVRARERVRRRFQPQRVQEVHQHLMGGDLGQIVQVEFFVSFFSTDTSRTTVVFIVLPPLLLATPPAPPLIVVGPCCCSSSLPESNDSPISSDCLPMPPLAVAPTPPTPVSSTALSVPSPFVVVVIVVDVGGPDPIRMLPLERTTTVAGCPTPDAVFLKPPSTLCVLESFGLPGVPPVVAFAADVPPFALPSADWSPPLSPSSLMLSFYFSPIRPINRHNY
uniref:Uncharacterized protein n=1 Tax=Anopheles farauti TaxID=69004 RepID=A0A182QKJ2_9DIPT